MRLMIITLRMGLLLILALTVVSCADEPAPTVLSSPTATQPPLEITATQVVIPAVSAITPPIDIPTPTPTLPLGYPPQVAPTFGEPENSATATVLNLPNPPVEIPLGKIPDNCTDPPIPPELAPSRIAPALGGNPIWMVHPQNFELTFATSTRYGYYESVLWAVEASFTDTLSLRGYNVGDYSAVWFDTQNGRPPQQVPTLDLNYSYNGAADWNMFFIKVYFPSAGCYAIEAAWPGGSWRIEVAVGKKS